MVQQALNKHTEFEKDKFKLVCTLRPDTPAKAATNKAPKSL